MSDRVDKAWSERGLDQYSTTQILMTLAHYGVKIDEAAFTEQAKIDFPLAIAQLWHEGWKGKGQFTRFPAAAAEELWHRLLPGAIAPTDLALSMINLLKQLDVRLGGKPDDGTLETRFKVVEAYVEKVPTEKERRERFESEVMMALGEWSDVFDQMGEALATKKLLTEAERLVNIEEKLLPVRAGAARALVRAAKGEKAEAVQELLAMAADATRDPFNRIAVCDALSDLSEKAEAAKALLTLLDVAEKAHDMELAADAVERLDGLMHENPKLVDRGEVLRRVKAIEAALDEKQG